jgi:hypothetical protein
MEFLQEIKKQRFALIQEKEIHKPAVQTSLILVLRRL